MSGSPKRSGWDLIEDAMYAVEATAGVMTLIAVHIEDEENKATAFDTLTRHLNSDLDALRKGFSQRIPSTAWCRARMTSNDAGRWFPSSRKPMPEGMPHERPHRLRGTEDPGWT